MQKTLATVLLVIILAGAAYWLFMPRDLPDTTPATAPVIQQPTTPTPVEHHPVIEDDAPLTAAPTPDAVTPAPVEDDLVPPPATLDGSDSTVLEAVSQLSADAAEWLLPQEQIRKWVVLVNALADGKVPVKDRPLEYPLPPFKAQEKDGSLWLDRANYGRTTLLIKALTRMPPSRVARQYAAWQPLLQQAQDELGNGADFDERLHTAIDRILAIRPLTGPVELKAGVLKFTYADPQMEKASGVEKLLWRLGPSNTLRIQNYLRDLKPLL